MSVFSPAAAIRAAVLITGSTYFTYIAGLIVGAVIARQLGPDDYGRYAYLVWFASVFVILGNNGLTVTVIRFVSETLGRNEPDQAARVHGWVYQRQLIVLVAVALLVFLLGPRMVPEGWQYGTGVFVAMAILAGVAKSVYLFQVSVAKGHGRFYVEAYSMMGLSLVNLVGVALLFWSGAGLIEYCWFFAIVSVGYLIWSTWLLRRDQIRAKFTAPATDLLARVRPHMWWSVLMILALGFSNKTIETYILNQYTTAAQVGFFVIAATLTRSGVDVVATGLNTVLMPLMAHGFGQSGKSKVDALLSDALRYFQFLGLIVAGVGFFWAEPLVVLIYGESYKPAVLIFQIMVLVAGIGLSEGVVGALLSTTDNQRLRAAFLGVAMLVSLVAAVVLVPRFGLMGAVISHACSHLLIVVLGLFVARRLSGGSLPWRALFRLGLAALVAAVVAWVMWRFVDGLTGNILAGFVYAAILIVLVRALGFWHEKDARVMSSVTERLPVIVILVESTDFALLSRRFLTSEKYSARQCQDY